MNTNAFIASIALTLGVVGLALAYLRGHTRRVLLMLCHTEVGADFWLRSADVLALAGSLLLVVTFGGFQPELDVVMQLRLSFGLALAGLFVTVMIVASSVWRQVVPATTPAAGTAA
jgi:hypothetical protein